MPDFVTHADRRSPNENKYSPCSTNKILVTLIRSGRGRDPKITNPLEMSKYRLMRYYIVQGPCDTGKSDDACVPVHDSI